MKKLSIISNQIKNNTYSYTGKGSFEAIVNNNKEKIIGWLEDLMPLQKQIDLLSEQENIEFQKRNYTRILTKLLPQEYKEFVSVNILVRDSNIIAKYYDDEFNLTMLYNKLLENKYLKYPGKYEKYVEYNIFQRFVMMYKDDLALSLDSTNQNNKNTTKVKQTTSKKEEIETMLEQTEVNIEEEILVEDTISEIKKEPKKEKKPKRIKEEVKGETKSKADTNWTQLLLGKLK
jgi:hypothetical protein